MLDLLLSLKQFRSETQGNAMHCRQPRQLSLELTALHFPGGDKKENAQQHQTKLTNIF